MVRLPDIPIQSWLTDQQQRFREATDGLFPALEFETAIRQNDAETPPDFDAPGGRDQWEEVERNNLAESYRQQQREHEEQQRQQQEQLAEQYRQQQAQAEAAQAVKQQAAEQAAHQEAMDRGIPTPENAFAMPAPDNTSTSGIFDSRDADAGAHELSLVDQFNAHANGLMSADFGPTPDPASNRQPEAPPDNTSTSGIFDQLGSQLGETARNVGSTLAQAPAAIDKGMRRNVGAFREGADAVGTAVESSPYYQALTHPFGSPVGQIPDVVQGVRALDKAGQYAVEQYGIGHMIEQKNRQAELEREAGADPLRGMVSSEWEAVNPEKAEELRKINEEQFTAVGGMVGTGGGGGLADDAVQAIKTLLKHGFTDEALGMEKALAARSEYTLTKVQELTRGIKPTASTALPDDVENPWPLTDEEKALNAAADAKTASQPAHSGYLEDQSFGADDVSTTEKGLPPEQMPPEARADTPPPSYNWGVQGAPARGVGRINPAVSPEAREIIINSSDAAREAHVPYTQEQLFEDARQILPGEASAIRANAKNVDPKRAAQEVTVLKQFTEQHAEELSDAFRRKDTLAEELAQWQRENPRAPLSAAPPELAEEIAANVDDIRLFQTRYEESFKGASLATKSASRVLNAVKGSRAGAIVFREIENLTDAAQTASKAAKAVRTAIDKGRPQDALKELEDVAVRLKNKRTNRIMTEASEGEGALKRSGLKAKTTPEQDAELKRLTEDAKLWAQRSRKMPDQVGLREELADRFDALIDHSDEGMKIAKELSERFEVHIDEDAFRRAASTEQKAANTLRSEWIKGIVQQIEEVKKNPHGPDAVGRMEELYKDLEQLGVAGFQRASKLREGAYRRGVLESGKIAAGVNKTALLEAFTKVRPGDASTLKPILEAFKSPGKMALLREMSFINMLSNPYTHATNIRSTLLNIATHQLLENPVSFIMSGGANRGGFGAIKGLGQGLAQGAGPARDIMLTGVNPKRVERMMAEGNLDRLNQEILPDKLAKVGLGKLGSLMHMVSTRPLEAADAIMGQMAYASAFNEQAARKADRMLRQGYQATRQEILQDIHANPWDHMDVLEKAGKMSDYSLYRGVGTSKAESVIRQAMALKNPKDDAGIGAHALGTVLDFLMPFYNVPMNVTKQGLVSTFGTVPLAVRGTGNLLRGNREEAGEQFARAAKGAAMIGTAYLLAANESLTGPGPQDPGDRAVWLLDHKVNSWRIPGVTDWMSWEGTPYAIPFGTAAGAWEGYKYARTNPNDSDAGKVVKTAQSVGKGLGAGILSQTLLEGAARNFEFLTGQSTGLSPLAQSSADTVARYAPTPLIGIPTGMLNFLAQVTDSVERDPGKPQPEEFGQNIVQRLRARTPDLQAASERLGYGDVTRPYLTEGRAAVPERLNAYGEPVRNYRYGPSGAAAAAFFGTRGPAGYEDDAITGQIERGSIGMPAAPRELPAGKGSIPLTIQEQKEFQRIWGEEFRRHLEDRGAGTEPLTVRSLEIALNRARDQAVRQIKASISDEDYERRRRSKPVEEIAP